MNAAEDQTPIQLGRHGFYDMAPSGWRRQSQRRWVEVIGLSANRVRVRYLARIQGARSAWVRREQLRLDYAG